MGNREGELLPEPAMTELPGYEFVKRLGEGSGGSVYLARQVGLSRLVAVKHVQIISPTRTSKALIKRFRREARAMAQLDHPNIVGVLDFLSEDRDLFLILEYIEGPTLRQVQSYLTLPTSLHIVSEITSAVDYARSRGIVHRDLKPENVLFARSGQSKLTDFGIAKIVSATAYGGQLSAFSTQAGNILGTAAYISPEAAGAKGRLDHRADLYGLGVMTYELLVRRLPFPPGPDLYSTLVAHATEPVPRPTALVIGFPENVEAVLLRALEKDPERRQPDVGAFWLELQAAASSAWPGWESEVNLSELTAAGVGTSHGAVGAEPPTIGSAAGPPTVVPSSDRQRGPLKRPDDRPTINAGSNGEVDQEAGSGVGRRPVASGGSSISSAGTSRQGPPQSGGPDPSVWQPKRRPRRLRLVLVAAAVVAVGLVVGILVARGASPPTLSGLAIAAVTVSTQPSSEGRCPQAQFLFRGAIDTNGGSGALRYQWTYPNTVLGPIATASVPSGTKQVVETLQFAYSGSAAASGAATLHVVSPTDVSSAPSTVQYQCP
jgi:serine/threonine-protein kinase